MDLSLPPSRINRSDPVEPEPEERGSDFLKKTLPRSSEVHTHWGRGLENPQRHLENGQPLPGTRVGQSPARGTFPFPFLFFLRYLLRAQ